MSDAQQGNELAVVRAAEIAGTALEARWLIHSLWSRAGVGVLGGPPKCCKSWLALEMAVAVSSGVACLGQFAVHDPGSVLLCMVEDATSVVKTRLAGICHHRGVDLGRLDVHLIAVSGLRLEGAEDQARLADAVASHRPRLLILDPFMRMHCVDESDACQVTALLVYLRELQRVFDVAITLVHHASRTACTSRPWYTLRGSVELLAWADSLLHLRRQRDQLLLTVDHRSAPTPEPFRLSLAGDQHAHLEVVSHQRVRPPAQKDRSALDRAIVEALMAGPLSRAQLRERLRVRNERLGQALVRLAQAGFLRRSGHKWGLADASPP